MSFSGTQQKCKSCDKTVHFIDAISADGVIYHKTCFRCSHCNGLLVISNYSSLDGMLFCKPHFEQFVKSTGGVARKALASSKLQGELSRTPSKLSSMFSGTQDKCAACKKTVYPLEKVTVEGAFYHKSCFRCAHGGCFISPSNYAAIDGFLYCKIHFAQLFKEKGSYNHMRSTSMKKNAEKADSESNPASDSESNAKEEETPEQEEAPQEEEQVAAE